MVQRPPWHDELVTGNVSPRNGAKPKIIVFHDTSGSGTHNDTLYLVKQSDGRKVSADFTVERDGSIWKLNPQIRLLHTWHAGRNTRWNNLRDGGVNRYSIGIEMCRAANRRFAPEWPDAQVGSAAWLAAWLCDYFNLGPESITTHRQLVWDGSRADPVRFPFEGVGGFWAQFHAIRGFREAHLAALEEHDNPDTFTG
jgi:N-acetyl-anhydromuramyl-L-alanine amidase AmpD